MSYNVVFLGWNRVVPGREQAGAEMFQNTLQYLGRLQQAGTIESFEPVLLQPHGGDLNGFILIRGKAENLDAMQASEEWLAAVSRGGLILEGLGVVGGATGDVLMEWMNRWMELIPG
jgi:hypothetical protein